ncbi:TIGR04348 family glycosyltransferase [Duganella callida]|uniref:TIGR04348 family glycosyltransferase n=1 Tax=Duganella callida TaxID=2561932 RepID=A0A4Y9S9E1_9BURK|nr:TIGR04348 family glycosyltransferase [Duganella callida]
MSQHWPDEKTAAAARPADADADADDAAVVRDTAVRGLTPHASARPNHSSEAPPDLLIALHARRSAASLDAWTRAHLDRPSLLLLTGTDLYRDIAIDADAQRSLQQADALVLLQPAGYDVLPAALHAKTSVIYQSAPALKPLPASAGARRHADICMIGHLRSEKDPLTFMHAAALVSATSARLIHIGGALAPELEAAAQATAASHASYQWLGALPHAATRQRLKRCRAMAITSRMEGGANVIIEAVRAGVPVLASDISGNRGMLGDDYAGYFPLGDAAALAALIDRIIEDDAYYRQLRAQCDVRSALFAPEAEQAALLELVDNLLHKT